MAEMIGSVYVDVQSFTDLELLQYLIMKYSLSDSPNEVHFIKDDSDIEMICKYSGEPTGSKELLIPIGKDHTAHLFLTEEALHYLMENIIEE